MSPAFYVHSFTKTLTVVRHIVKLSKQSHQLVWNLVIIKKISALIFTSVRFSGMYKQCSTVFLDQVDPLTMCNLALTKLGCCLATQSILTHSLTLL